MPVCSYFLLSQCTRDNCPYRHVNVGDDAAVCEDFLKGYCPEGDKVGEVLGIFCRRTAFVFAVFLQYTGGHLHSIFDYHGTFHLILVQEEACARMSGIH